MRSHCSHDELQRLLNYTALNAGTFPDFVLPTQIAKLPSESKKYLKPTVLDIKVAYNELGSGELLAATVLSRSHPW
jgi:hypothetical protein